MAEVSVGAAVGATRAWSSKQEDTEHAKIELYLTHSYYL